MKRIQYNLKIQDIGSIKGQLEEKKKSSSMNALESSLLNLLNTVDDDGIYALANMSHENFKKAKDIVVQNDEKELVLVKKFESLTTRNYKKARFNIEEIAVIKSILESHDKQKEAVPANLDEDEIVRDEEKLCEKLINKNKRNLHEQFIKDLNRATSISIDGTLIYAPINEINDRVEIENFYNQHEKFPLGNLHQGLVGCFSPENAVIFNHNNAYKAENTAVLYTPSTDDTQFTYESISTKDEDKVELKYSQIFKCHSYFDSGNLKHLITNQAVNQSEAQEVSLSLGLEERGPLEIEISHSVAKIGDKFTFGLSIHADYDSRVNQLFINELSAKDMENLKQLGIEVSRKEYALPSKILTTIKDNPVKMLGLVVGTALCFTPAAPISIAARVALMGGAAAVGYAANEIKKKLN